MKTDRSKIEDTRKEEKGKTERWKRGERKGRIE